MRILSRRTQLAIASDLTGPPPELSDEGRAAVIDLARIIREARDGSQRDHRSAPGRVEGPPLVEPVEETLAETDVLAAATRALRERRSLDSAPHGDGRAP